MRWLLARIPILSSRPAGSIYPTASVGPFFHPCPPERLRRPTKGRDRPLPGMGNPALASCSRNFSDTSPSPPSCARFAPSRVSQNQSLLLANSKNPHSCGMNKLSRLEVLAALEHSPTVSQSLLRYVQLSFKNSTTPQRFYLKNLSHQS
jgi:hypothetical protein